MSKRSILSHIKELKRPIFTTHEISCLSGKSLSGTTQSLNFLEREGMLFKICRGIWGEKGSMDINPYSVIPFLLPRHRVYVSFISALHLYGIIEQIPRVITLASTGHTKTIKTTLGTFEIHKIKPSFFKGFDWYKEKGAFLIAGQEKALVDSLYLSARKKKQYSFFPELHFPKSFSKKKTNEWVKLIPDPRIRSYVHKKLRSIISKNTSE